jgi:hypothetical protein
LHSNRNLKAQKLYAIKLGALITIHVETITSTNFNSCNDITNKYVFNLGKLDENMNRFEQGQNECNPKQNLKVTQVLIIKLGDL